jgi:hypothetical protein
MAPKYDSYLSSPGSKTMFLKSVSHFIQVISAAENAYEPQHWAHQEVLCLRVPGDDSHLSNQFIMTVNRW